MEYQNTEQSEEYGGYANPCIHRIHAKLKKFVGVDALLISDWYDRDTHEPSYIKQKEAKACIREIWTKLASNGYDPDEVFSGLFNFWKHFKTNPESVPFFNEVLLDFYKFLWCPMDVTWNIMEKTDALLLYHLMIWECGDFPFNSPAPYRSFWVNDIYFLVVEDFSAGDKYKETALYLGNHLGVKINDLVGFVGSCKPLGQDPNWISSFLDTVLRQTISRAQDATYTGPLLIDERLASIIYKLFHALDYHVKGRCPARTCPKHNSYDSYNDDDM